MNAPLAPGTLLDNRYRVVGVAKRGAFGQTYLARDQKQLNELCVLKEFVPVQSDPAVLDNLLQLFHREASVLYGLRHPQLPRPRAMLSQGQRFYWVREYVEGKSYGVLLEGRKAQGQAFSESEVIHLLTQVLPVLGYLHSRGVIHGNLSLDSLILRQQDQLPVLINYGLVRDLVARLQLHPVRPEDAIGTWGYVPPEKVRDRKLYPNSDLYSLGVVALALLTAKAPEELFSAKTQSFEWEQSVNATPRLVRVLKQMLAPQPQKRFASAAEATQALEPLLESAGTDTATVVPPVSAPPVVSSPPPPTEPVVPPVEPVTAAATSAAVEAPRTAKHPRRRGAGDSRATIALLIGLALLLGVIGWRVLSAIFGKPSSPTAPTPEMATSPDQAPQSAPSPAASPSPVAIAPAKSADKATTQPTDKPPPKPTTKPAPPKPAVPAPGASQAVKVDGVSNQYFTSLVDAIVQAQSAQVGGQATGNQDTWNATASDVASKLATLPPETRKKLGSYTLADYNRWLAELGETGKTSSPTLDALADGRFYQLFPEWRGKRLDPKTMGQVWYAIADSMVEPAKDRLAANKR